VQVFAQEISLAISGYGGYVFKYEGDAVIVLFPAEYDQVKACGKFRGKPRSYKMELPLSRILHCVYEWLEN
jgi:class 3 adenylate cyclase